MTEQQTEYSATQLRAARQGKCPTCLSSHLIAGPRGGLSRNWYCDACKSAWNMGHTSVDYKFRDVFFVQRIEWPGDDVLEIYRV